ncbi:MAG: hypothetical protein RIS85_2525, partial [Pseudomonadota bacterium]
MTNAQTLLQRAVALREVQDMEG